MHKVLIRGSVCVDALRHSQQYFTYVGAMSCLPGLKRIMCLAQEQNIVRRILGVFYRVHTLELVCVGPGVIFHKLNQIQTNPVLSGH